MTTDSKTVKQRAIDVIVNSADDISQQELLFSIHQQLSLEDSIEVGRSVRSHRTNAPKSSWISNLQDAAGCMVVPLILIVIFAAMPFLFSIGERLIKRPARSVAEGVIQTIEFSDASLHDYPSKNCIIYDSYIEIRNAGERIFIPRERLKSIQIDAK